MVVAAIIFDGEDPDLVAGESVEREVIDEGGEFDSGVVLGAEEDAEVGFKAKIFVRAKSGTPN